MTPTTIQMPPNSITILLFFKEKKRKNWRGKNVIILEHEQNYYYIYDIFYTKILI